MFRFFTLLGLCLSATALPAFAQTATAGQLIITEFRLHGASSNSDEFIEIYNASEANHTVVAASGTGYGVAASDSILRCSIPNGTVIPRRGHFLCVNSIGYSLASYPAGNGTTATGDVTYTVDIPLNAGIALFNNNLPVNFTLANRLDAVGSTSEANIIYKEGAGYPLIANIPMENYSFYRDLSSGQPKDTNDNAADFDFAEVNGTSAGAGQHLGAPGPENLSSPIERNQWLTSGLIDPSNLASAAPNRVRDTTSDPANNSVEGTIDIRRRFTNTTGFNVTRLRFRIVNISTFPSPSGIADLRPRTSTAVLVSGINSATVCAPNPAPCTITVEGTTLEQPPNQLNGGGFNSTLSAGTVTLATPLLNGQSINVRWLNGVQQKGNFVFYVNVEMLP